METTKKIAIQLGLFRPLQVIYRKFFRTDWSRRLKEEIELYSQFIEPGDLVFDVGANVGRKSEIFLALNARVVAFEPQPDCYEELQARCGYSSRFKAVRSALGSEEGTLPLYIREHSGASSLVSDWQQRDVLSTTKVQVKTLDAAINEYGLPKYIKIDVEGYEIEVLRGLTQLPDIISFECHWNRLETGLKCLNQIESLATNVCCNTITEGTSELTFQKWLDKDAFVDELPALAERSDSTYGDIFVKRK